jgi:cation transport ATPase
MGSPALAPRERTASRRHVSMADRSTAAFSEAAGVVLLVDQLEPLAKAIVIAKRTRISRFKASSSAPGYRSPPWWPLPSVLTPVQDALLQEAIDVAVILNALRAPR